MTDDLVRSIYTSSTAHDLSKAELISILEVSRRNNARDDITGALAYHDRAFFQVLEGPRVAVEALLARIRTDGRHKGIMILDRSLIDERVFGQWGMGWLDRSELMRAGFDLDILRIDNTASPMLNVMLNAFRQIVRLN